MTATEDSRLAPKNRFQFSQNWFQLIVHEWTELTRPISFADDGSPKEIRILEVGSFEGASTTWMLDNMMGHPKSKIVAVDTFEGGMEHRSSKPERPDELGYNLSTLEMRFINNVSQCKNFKKLEIIKALSSTALLQLRRDDRKFDFIYIDGSHVAFDVISDAVLAWPMLAVGGMLVFDDSRWKGYNEDCYNPRVAVMSFTQCVKQEARVHETESQTWVTKVDCFIKPTPNDDPDLYYWDDGYLRYTSYP